MDRNKLELINFKPLGDPSLGYISVAENASLPFEIRRVFWSYYTPHHIIRGKHAHHKLQQILIATAGIIKVSTEDRAGNKKEFILDSPSVGLHLPARFWHTMEFSHSAVLMSLASMEYAEDDYIRDYTQFKKGNG